MLLSNYQSCNLIGPYHFLEISLRNSTLFTRLFLTGRRAQAGHKSSSTVQLYFMPIYGVSHTAAYPLDCSSSTVQLYFMPIYGVSHTAAYPLDCSGCATCWHHLLLPLLLFLSTLHPSLQGSLGLCMLHGQCLAVCKLRGKENSYMKMEGTQRNYQTNRAPTVDM